MNSKSMAGRMNRGRALTPAAGNTMAKPKDEDIDFNSIAAMMCGLPLTEAQEKDTRKFNEQYDTETAKRKRMGRNGGIEA